MNGMEERTQRHVATLAALNAACALAMAVIAALTLFAVVGATDPIERSFYLYATVFFALLGGVNGVIWRGLQQLSPTARLTQMAVAVVALVGFPLGTVWGAYALWVLVGSSGRKVFATEYREAHLAERARPYRAVVAAGVSLGIFVVLAGLFVVPQELVRLYEQERNASVGRFNDEADDDGWPTRGGPLDDVQIIINDGNDETD